jgi:hypothetical protein
LAASRSSSSAVVAVHVQDAVLHLFVVDHEDREDAVVRQRQELDLAQRGVRCGAAP